MISLQRKYHGVSTQITVYGKASFGKIKALSDDESMKTKWRYLLRSLGNSEIAFCSVMEGIQVFLQPVWDAILNGEVNEAEVYRLRQWMNTYRDSIRNHKPSESLCKIVDDIPADGIVTETEQKQLLQMLSARISGSRIINVVLTNAIVPRHYLSAFFEFIFDIYKLRIFKRKV